MELWTVTTETPGFPDKTRYYIDSKRVDRDKFEYTETLSRIEGKQFHSIHGFTKHHKASGRTKHHSFKSIT